MKKVSIFLQLIIILFIVTAIPSCLVIYKNSRDMQELFQEKIAQSAVDKLKANKNLSDEVLSNIVYSVIDLVLSRQYSDLNGALSYDVLNSNYEYVNAAVKMQSNLTTMSDRNELVYSVFYYMDGADYVISTDNGVVEINDYENLDWLGDAESLIRGAEGIWYPRMTGANPVYEEREPVNVISFIYRLNSLYTSTKGVIVVNVYEEELNQMIFSEKNSSTREGILINSSGDVISHTAKSDLYSNLIGQKYIEDILNSENTTGYGETQVNGEDLLFAYQKSDLYDWIYINTYSLKSMVSESGQVLQMGMMTSLFITLIGVICAVLIAFKIIWPIRKLAKEVKDIEYGMISAEDSGANEIQYLTNTFNKIREREQVLMQKISDGEQSLVNDAMAHLMYGEEISEKSKLLLNEKFPYIHFLVCLLLVDNYSKYQNMTTHEQREITRYRIYELARELCPEDYYMGSVRFTGGSVAIVINIRNYDSINVKSEIRIFMKALQKKCEESLSIGLSVGISNVHSDFIGLKKCADEADEAAKYRLIFGQNNIFFYRPMEESHVQTYSVYQHEKRIINYLDTSKIESIEKELELLKENLCNTHGITVENVALIFNQLAGSILDYLNKHNYNVANVIGIRGNLHNILSEFETVSDTIAYLLEIYRRIVNYQMESEGENEDYGKIILRYLEQNYQTDIIFEDMAQKIGISYSYLRKIVKEETGKSLIDNLNEIRIEKAKQVLTSTDYSVVQISEMVGYHNAQSLNRFFQRYEGLSPNEYRIKMAVSKDK